MPSFFITVQLSKMKFKTMRVSTKIDSEINEQTYYNQILISFIN